MEENKTKDILKKLLLPKQQGKAFYRHVADNTENSEIKSRCRSNR